MARLRPQILAAVLATLGVVGLQTSACVPDVTLRASRSSDDAGTKKKAAAEEEQETPPTEPTSPTSTSPTGDTETSPEPGPDEPGQLDAAAADPVDAAPPPPTPACAGKADGFKLPAGPKDRCCGSVAVDIRTAANCGGCGIKCPSGFACEQPVPGEWGCRCATNASCVTAGYGPGATCYLPPAPAVQKAFCNCQCPNATATCDGTCRGGSRCNDVPGQNYCGYP